MPMVRTRSRDLSMSGPGAGGGALTSFPSPSSSSSSDFEFTVYLSPSTRRSAAQLCPADELFYKGNLLPLHLSPRISMVRTLILTSSSTSSSSDANTTASRDSTASSSSTTSSSSSFSAVDLLHPECDSSRPSSVTENDTVKRSAPPIPRRPKYFSSFATRFSSVFIHLSSKKDPSSATIPILTPPPKKQQANPTAKEVIKKYVKKMKLSLKSQQDPDPHHKKRTFTFSSIRRGKNAAMTTTTSVCAAKEIEMYNHSLSFSGNLRYPRRKKRCAAAESCPSSMGASPIHSGLVYAGDGAAGATSMEELQSAIQGAIAHCKSTMIQPNQHKAPARVSRGKSNGS